MMNILSIFERTVLIYTAYMKKYILLALLLMACTALSAQNLKWRASSKKVSRGVYEISLTADIPVGFHLYDLGPYDNGGPLATDIKFKPGAGVTLDGGLAAPAAKKVFDDLYDMEIGVYEGSATFTQRVRGKAKSTVDIEAKGMICSGMNCLPPRTQSVKVILK